MEHGEDTDQQSRDPKWRAGREGNHRAERDGRQRDADLDPRDRNPHRAEHPAEGHHQRERHRQHPDRRGAELRAPHADRNHRDHVVQPHDGVCEPRQESALHISLADVGQCHGRRKKAAQPERLDQS